MEILYCIFCGRECKNENSKRNHERLCKLNPSCDIKSLEALNRNRNSWNGSGHSAWNKGLSKETDPRIAKYSETNSRNTRGENNSFYGKKHSEETKRKISESQKKNYEGKSCFFTVLEHRKSYAERYFDKIFTDAEHQHRIGRFVLDYAWPDKKIYIEVDGEQHYTNEGIEHDRIRTDYLNEQGWKLITRIRWSEYQKLTREEKERLLSGIRSEL